jgi:hypothetical protein
VVSVGHSSAVLANVSWIALTNVGVVNSQSLPEDHVVEKRAVLLPRLVLWEGVSTLVDKTSGLEMETNPH